MISALILIGVSATFGDATISQQGILPGDLTKAGRPGEFVHEKSGLTFVYVQGGKSEEFELQLIPNKPPTLQQMYEPHPVTLPSFYISKYEVSVAQYKKFVDAQNYRTDAEKSGSCWDMEPLDPGFSQVKGVSWKSPGFSQEGSHPVVCLSYQDCENYCRWAGFEMPSASQWAKAGFYDPISEKMRLYPYGTGDARLKEGWPKGFENGSSDYFKQVAKIQASEEDGDVFTTSITSNVRGASAFGCLNILGNASEYVDGQNGRIYGIGGSYKSMYMLGSPVRFLEKTNPHRDIGFRPVIPAK